MLWSSGDGSHRGTVRLSQGNHVRHAPRHAAGALCELYVLLLLIKNTCFVERIGVLLDVRGWSSLPSYWCGSLPWRGR